ncbi:MAG: response regulator [Acidobacteriota bacterium]
MPNPTGTLFASTTFMRDPNDATVKSSMWGRMSDRIRLSLRFAGSTPVVLIAEDDADLRSYFEIALSRAGYKVESAADGREALQKLQEGIYDAIVLDLLLPAVHGATLLADIRTHHPELLKRIVVATGLPQGALPDAAGVAAILRKPFKVERLVEAVEACRKAGADDVTAP